MGFLDPFGDGVSVVSGGLSRPSKGSKRDSSRRRDSSRHRSTAGGSSKKRHRSRSRSSSSDRKKSGWGKSASGFFAALDGDGYSKKHSSSRASFFGLGDNRSKGSIFGSSKPSYYKRSSRHGFMHNTYKKLKRLIRDLVHWAKRHPWKVLFLVLMPLITTGVLAGLLARFGLRLPQGLERLINMAGKAATGDSVGLVGEAVKAAGSLGGGNTSAHAQVRVNGGRDGYYSYDSYGSRGGSGGGWTDSVMSTVKQFM